MADGVEEGVDQRLRRLQDVLNALPAGVVVLDGTGQIRDFNPAATVLLGRLAVGDLWRDVVRRTVAPQWDDGHDISLGNGRRVHIATEPLAAEPGQILLIADVTETRILQDQLGRYKRLSSMGEMAANLAHQVRTPLTSAILNVSNLSRGGVTEERRRRFADRTMDSLRHLERLVGDMLLFARGGAFDAKAVAVNTLLRDLAGYLAGAEQGAGIEYAVVSLEDDRLILINRDAMLSALGNLVSNAVIACGGKGRIELGARLYDEQVVELWVADDGPGIPSAILPSLFEPFFTTRSQGTGLGLAVARAVVHSHGGELSCESSQGCGATFRIHLPVAAGEGGAGGAEAASGGEECE
jgi:two-component system sensor histidine kinase FlrB